MKGKRIIILMAVVAAIVAPSALADNGTNVTIPSWLSQLRQPGTTTDVVTFGNVRGGPTGAYVTTNRIAIPSWLSQLRQPGGTSDLGRFENFRGAPGAAGLSYPSEYVGHDLGGPGAVGPVASIGGETPAGNGFDWADAAVGAGFAAGIALLVAAGVLSARRRRTLAHA